jgi:outer membrane receptor protein involved in Fe transport
MNLKIARNRPSPWTSEVRMAPWLWLAAAAVADDADSPLEQLEQLERIEDLSLRDLLDLEVDIATRTALPNRETPSAVSVITGEELRALGARDLADALRLLPSLEPGVDVYAATGFGVRGLWGFESRTQLIVDGVDRNETVYNSPGTFTGRIPAWMIDRIEVIRGPGSAVYGGTAELAVIQVTTTAAALDGGTVEASHRWLDSGAYSEREAGFAVAEPLGDDARLALQGTVGHGRQSDGLYRDVFGDTAPMLDGSAVVPAAVDGRAEIGRAAFGGGYERVHQTHRDGYYEAMPIARDSDLDQAWAWAEIAALDGPRGDLVPRISWTWSRPWSSRRGLLPTSSLYGNQWAHRVRASVIGRRDPYAGAGHPSLLGGAELTWDRGGIGPELPDAWLFGNGERQQDFANVAAFGQVVGRLRLATAVAGARLDVHTVYGAALAPRLALTRAGERWHAKLLASRAFRAPSLSQLRDRVTPETADTAEVELGAGPGEWLYGTGSAWVTVLSHPVLYVTEEDSSGQAWEGYRNDPGRTGSTGLELELRSGGRAGDLVFGWSSCTTAGLAQVDYFAVHPAEGAGTPAPGSPLGLPQHKGVLRGDVHLGERVDLGTVATWVGPRWAATEVQRGAARATRLDPALLLDLAVGVRDVGARGLSIGLSGHDLLDAAPPLAQPYDGWHAPLPAAGREIGVQLQYQRVRPKR